MQEKFFNHLLSLHKKEINIPSKKAICSFADNILQLIFPQVSAQDFKNTTEIEVYYNSIQNDLISIFTKMKDDLPGDPQKMVYNFMGQLEQITELLYKDAQAIAEGDPAATNLDLVISTYPGFFAISIYRIAHALYKLQVPYLPRFLTEFAHSKTGVDIHPGAEIGEDFFIDHGTGIVIGETTIIGKHVKLYQGVTLGALSVEKGMAKIKRHPTIEDHVVIYAGATILGGNTVIGSHSTIGGNVWLTESVPVYSKVYHNPQVQVRTAEDPSGIINFSI
ncbi:MAG: serine acetyltransferase [Bacteroidota bacterium]|nr:serine acetyltransferase [Bacteroidota bacterium]